MSSSEYIDYKHFKDILKPIKNNWKQVLQEALQNSYTLLTDSRSDKWYVAPLLPEPCDLKGMRELPQLMQLPRKISKKTVALCENIPNIQAYTFSKVIAGGSIKSHKHGNPSITILFTLQASTKSFILVEKEKKYFIPGEFIIFDYRELHEIYNDTDTDRTALLILVPIKETLPNEIL